MNRLCTDQKLTDLDQEFGVRSDGRGEGRENIGSIILECYRAGEIYCCFLFLVLLLCFVVLFDHCVFIALYALLFSVVSLFGHDFNFAYALLIVCFICLFVFTFMYVFYCYVLNILLTRYRAGET